MAYLRAFAGVGPKTANCVLLFSFGMSVFPVDTHIHRLAIRLGLIPPKATAEQAHDLLTPAIAPQDRYPLHVLLIAHGRAICKPARPRCVECVLLDLCPTGLARVKGEPAVPVPSHEQISLSSKRPRPLESRPTQGKGRT